MTAPYLHLTAVAQMLGKSCIETQAIIRRSHLPTYVGGWFDPDDVLPLVSERKRVEKEAADWKRHPQLPLEKI